MLQCANFYLCFGSQSVLPIQNPYICITIMGHTSQLFGGAKVQNHSPFPFHKHLSHSVTTWGHKRSSLSTQLHWDTRANMHLPCSDTFCTPRILLFPTWPASGLCPGIGYSRPTALICDFSSCLPEAPIMPFTKLGKWTKFITSSNRKQRVEGRSGANVSVILVKPVVWVTGIFSSF